MTKNKYFAYFKVMFILGIVNSVVIGLSTLSMVLSSIVEPVFLVFVLIFGGVLAVYIIGTTKFAKFSKYTEEQLLADRNSLTLWCVLFSILLFPMGLLSLIPLFNLNEEFPVQQTQYVHKAMENNVQPVKNSMDDKLEKIQKYYEMKEKGVLSLEDFLVVKERILNE